MAEPEQEKSTVSLTTKLGSLSLGGKDALTIALYITMLALSGLNIYEHIQRSKEHDDIVCAIKLNLFLQTLPVDKPIDWRRMPVDIYQCVPRFLYDREASRSQ